MRKAPLHVCVIGGGFTGAAAAIACVAQLRQPFRLSVVEPGAALGRGVAYGGHHPLHLLNVRTRDLSVRAGQPGDFLNWAFRQLDQGENHAGLHDGLGHTFLPRQLFGEYVRQRFFEVVEGRADVAFNLVTATATSCIAQNNGYTVGFDRSPPLIADVVILATAYGLQSATMAGALAPYDVMPSERLAAAKSVVLIGSGLTMVDVLLSARSSGFQGTATILSRRGQLPRPHAPKGVVPQQVGLPRSRRVSSLTASIRIACEAAEAHGTAWQAIINGLRPSLQEIWQGLETEEQARFLRHVRPFWDAHRHRLPIEVNARLQSELGEGRAVLRRCQVTEIERHGGRFRVALKPRGAGPLEIVDTDLAFDCSGHRPDLASPLIESLLRQGVARADPHHLGLAVESDGQVLDRLKLPSRGLFALGPLCQGTLWEITAVPEIVRQADRAAQRIATLQKPGLRAGTPALPPLQRAGSR